MAYPTQSSRIEKNKQLEEWCFRHMKQSEKRNLYTDAFRNETGGRTSMLTNSISQTPNPICFQGYSHPMSSESLVSPPKFRPPDPPDRVVSRSSENGFPKFDGTMLREWIHHCEQFFWLHNTPPELKTRVASQHMEGKALEWHRIFITNHYGIFPSWTDYAIALFARFGEPSPAVNNTSDVRGWNVYGCSNPLLPEVPNHKVITSNWSSENNLVSIVSSNEDALPLVNKRGTDHSGTKSNEGEVDTHDSGANGDGCSAEIHVSSIDGIVKIDGVDKIDASDVIKVEEEDEKHKESKEEVSEKPSEHKDENQDADTLVEEIQNLVLDTLTEQICVVDTHVSKKVYGLPDKKMMTIALERLDSITRAQPYLVAMCQKGEIGTGSKVKIVNELLQNIHLVVDEEVVSLVSQSSVHPGILYDIISNATGTLWVYKFHIPLLLEVTRQKLILGLSHIHENDLATSLAKVYNSSGFISFSLGKWTNILLDPGGFSVGSIYNFIKLKSRDARATNQKKNMTWVESFTLMNMLESSIEDKEAVEIVKAVGEAHEHCNYDARRFCLLVTMDIHIRSVHVLQSYVVGGVDLLQHTSNNCYNDNEVLLKFSEEAKSLNPAIISKTIIYWQESSRTSWFNGDVAVPLSVSYFEAELLHVVNDSHIFLFTKKKETTEAGLGKSVTKVVVHVPVYFNNALRQATKDDIRIASRYVKRTFNEPAAAALSFGMTNKMGLFVVFDPGGETFDVSVSEIYNGCLEVKATNDVPCKSCFKDASISSKEDDKADIPNIDGCTYFLGDQDRLIHLFAVTNEKEKVFNLKIELLSETSISSTISEIRFPSILPKMFEGLASIVAFDPSSGIAAWCTENYYVQLYNLLNDWFSKHIKKTHAGHLLSSTLKWFNKTKLVHKWFNKTKLVHKYLVTWKEEPPRQAVWKFTWKESQLMMETKMLGLNKVFTKFLVQWKENPPDQTTWKIYQDFIKYATFHP